MKSRQDTARDMLAEPLFAEIMTELEAVAVNSIVYARYDDDEARLNAAAEIRAIREFRSKLEALSQGQPDFTGGDVPA